MRLHRFWMAAFFAAACAANGSSNSGAITPGADEIVIGSSLSFSPPHLTVAAGTTVRWRNAGPYGHTVTSGLSSKAADHPGAEFDTQLPSGETFEFTFDEVGDHPYFCRPHEGMGMKGVITVTAATAAPADAGPQSDSAGGTDNGGGGGGGGSGGGGGGYGY
jgi:plastocyanin